MARKRSFFREIGRLSQIVDVLAKYGFGYFSERLHLDQSFLGRKLLSSSTRSQYIDLPGPVRMRKVLEELGPTFIKFGQIISTRPDILPIEYCHELQKLQDEVPPFPLAQVEEQIQKELKHPVGEIFGEFSEHPFAAASLAQVHLAELKSGKKVIVKIQRPKVGDTIERDLVILEELARLANRYVEELRPYNPVQMVREFRQAILQELDFTIEASNTDRIRAQFEEDPTVRIPRNYPEYSGKHVLVMERIEGLKITYVEAIRHAGLDPVLIARNGANAFLKQIFIHGFFHADPHPGNLFALPGNAVGFIDFGMVGRLHNETKAKIAALLIAIANRDIEKLLEAAVAMGAIQEEDSHQALAWDLEDFLDRYYVSSLKQLKLGEAVKELVEIMSRHRIRMPQEMTMLSKTLITIEGVGEVLDPNFDMVSLTTPFAQQLVLRRYTPKRLLEDARNLVETLYDFAVTFPQDLHVLINKLKSGNLTVELQHRGLEKMIHTLDKVSNRLSFSVIIAAIIIGSSIVVLADKGPDLLGYPAIGVIGFMAAVLLGLWLVISIIRSGRL